MGRTVPKDVVDKVGAAEALRVSREIKNGLMTGEGSPYANALRVFRTEINRAHGEAYQATAFAHPDVIGTRFLLSPNHPMHDVCDMHAHANLYGLGPGVYPQGKNPWPAHPNTLSYTEVVFHDEITDADRAGQQDRISWLKDQPPQVREGVLGGRNKRIAFDAGHIGEGEIATPWRIIKERLEKRRGGCRGPVKVAGSVRPSGGDAG
jgi:hypothetical protein